MRRRVDVSWAHGYRQLAGLRGIRVGHGGDRRSTDARAAGQAGELARELGVSPRTARRRLALAHDLAAHPELVEQVDSGELSAQEARGAARKQALQQLRARAARAGRRAPIPAGAEIRVGDFAQQLATLGDASVGLIYTDSPYLLSYDLEWVYGELARQAARVLKPGASLITYTGGYALPRALAALPSPR